MLSSKCVYKSYIYSIYIYKKYLVLNNHQLLIFHKTKPNQILSSQAKNNCCSFTRMVLTLDYQLLFDMPLNKETTPHQTKPNQTLEWILLLIHTYLALTKIVVNKFSQLQLICLKTRNYAPPPWNLKSQAINHHAQQYTTQGALSVAIVI